jgi:electron transfer flavoprotein beta subunit
MRIVVCIKEVPDPDAVNSYALARRLEIGADGRTLAQTAIPLLMNAYDEQAIEAALRLRDAGIECSITAVLVGANSARGLLRHAAALGATETVLIEADLGALDGTGVAAILAAYIQTSGGADLVLCGRQASDDDQGVVPAVLGERLGMPVITMARAVTRPAEGTVRVTRVTPDGDELVEAALPAVVTISNELGLPRYPKGAAMMAARRMTPTLLTPAALGLSPADLAPRVTLTRLFVPQVQGNCEFITGDGPADLAARLLERLRADRVLA